MGDREGKPPEITEEVVIPDRTTKDWTPYWNPVLKDEGLDPDTLKWASMIMKEDARQLKKRGRTEHRLQRWFVILQREMGELADAIDREKPDDVVEESLHVSTTALKIAAMTKKWGRSPLIANAKPQPARIFPSPKVVGERMRNWYKTSVPKCEACHDVYLVHSERRKLGLCAKCELLQRREKWLQENK